MGGCRTDGSDIDSVDPVPLYGITKQELQEDYFDEQEDDFDEDFDEESGCAIYCVSKIFSITNLALNEQFDFFLYFVAPRRNLQHRIWRMDENSQNTRLKNRFVNCEIFATNWKFRQRRMMLARANRLISTLNLSHFVIGHSTSVYKSKMYVFGGLRTGTYSYKLASSCVYDRKSNAWTMLPNMHRKRHLAGKFSEKLFKIIRPDSLQCRKIHYLVILSNSWFSFGIYSSSVALAQSYKQWNKDQLKENQLLLRMTRSCSIFNYFCILQLLWYTTTLYTSSVAMATVTPKTIWRLKNSILLRMNLNSSTTGWVKCQGTATST